MLIFAILILISIGTLSNVNSAHGQWCESPVDSGHETFHWTDLVGGYAGWHESASQSGYEDGNWGLGDPYYWQGRRWYESAHSRGSVQGDWHYDDEGFYGDGEFFEGEVDQGGCKRTFMSADELVDGDCCPVDCEEEAISAGVESDCQPGDANFGAAPSRTADGAEPGQSKSRSNRGQLRSLVPTPSSNRSPVGTGTRTGSGAAGANSRAVVNAIRDSGLTIYDKLTDRKELIVGNQELENILNDAMVGTELDYKLRARAKVARQAVCRALGYPVPDSFKQTRPRFPGQDLDCYVQKSDNLQIWNEELDPSRRYAIIKLDDKSTVSKVRVATGAELGKLAGPVKKMTSKVQAIATNKFKKSTLLSQQDTPSFQSEMKKSSKLMPIDELYNSLSQLIGQSVPYEGKDQERNRGEGLHRLICQHLGTEFSDSGSSPDIVEQLIEVKLQTAETVNLGATSPDSEQSLGSNPSLKQRDVRYAIFYADNANDEGKEGAVKLTRLALVTGADFYDHYTRFENNSKIQIKLPADFFE